MDIDNTTLYHVSRISEISFLYRLPDDVEWPKKRRWKALAYRLSTGCAPKLKFKYTACSKNYKMCFLFRNFKHSNIWQYSFFSLQDRNLVENNCIRVLVLK